jgi:lipopolysaccharide biosynthesis glycosyltransferase
VYQDDMDIVTSAEGSYIQGAEAMLFSFLSYNPGPHSVYMLSQEDPGRFHDIGRLCALAGTRFCHVDPRALVCGMRGARDRVNGVKNMATYHRIYAGHLLPPGLSKVLYLDSDLLVRRSLASLWELELGDHYLAASTMTTLVKRPDFLAKFGGRYFTSGVMLINLDRWRRDDVSGQCERILLERPQDVTYCDQCLLNFACRPWLEVGIDYNFYYSVAPKLARRFGVSRRRFRTIASSPAIIHFVGAKPWKKEPSDLYQLEREYPLCREAFERVIADRNWTGLSIHQQQAEARAVERKALRRAERRRLDAEQRRLERKAGRQAAKRQARVEERRIERKALRTAMLLARSAEIRAQRKARRRQARAAEQRLERKRLRTAERKARRTATLLAEAAEIRAQRKARRRQARAAEQRLERKRLRTAERKALRTATLLAEAAEIRAQRKARRRQARAEAAHLQRKGAAPLDVTGGKASGDEGRAEKLEGATHQPGKTTWSASGCAASQGGSRGVQRICISPHI